VVIILRIARPIGRYPIGSLHRRTEHVQLGVMSVDDQLNPGSTDESATNCYEGTESIVLELENS
jgi:hypothetical protein